MAWIGEIGSVPSNLNYFECVFFFFPEKNLLLEELFMSVFKYTRPVFQYARPEYVHICLCGTEQKETAS